ncbi:MAG: serine/threonine-protein kinase [Elainella sp. Prado103]|nr:serine/threonine-protein kinase [Elainella sp. Prado103]
MPRNPPETPLGGRYKIISQLGVGGFGRTFLAEDLHLPGNPCCVIKHLKPQSKNEETLQMARRCFNIEAQVLYHLGSHDQIPRLLAHFEEAQEFYLAQEFVEGEPLTRELAEGQPWIQERVLTVLRDVLQVLMFVHQQQVIHRDLKPSNLIRRRHDRRIVLIDFGAVKQVGNPEFDPATGLTNLTISIGTQGYMPNEQLAGKPKFCSDIYAVGVLAIQMLSGVHPRHFGEDSRGEIDWHKYTPEIRPELRTILDRMVRYDFRERYVDAAEVLQALSTLPADLLEAQLEMEMLDLSDAGSPSGITAGSGIKNAPHSGVGSSKSWGTPKLEYSHGKELAKAQEEPISTAIWLPAEPSNLPSSGTGFTQAIGRPHFSGTHSVPTTTSHLARRLTHPWMLVGLLATGLLATLGHFTFPQWSHQLLGQNSAATNATGNPNLSPTKDPLQQSTDLLAEAKRLQQAQQYEQALSVYDQAIAVKSDFAEAYAGRCETLNQLKRPEEAIVACNDALAYEPDYPEALWSQGNARLLQNRPYDALKLYENVTEKKPSFASGWVKLGVALQKLGRSAEALTALDQGIKLERNSAEAWLTKSEALFNLQRYDEALTAANKTLQLQPNDLKALDLRQKAKMKTN